MAIKNTMDQFMAEKNSYSHKKMRLTTWMFYGYNTVIVEISQDFMFLHIFCNIARPLFILFGLYLGGIVVT